MSTHQLFLRCLCLLLLPLFYLSAVAQMQVSGRVLDEKTDEPIANARLYFNNTSIGTVTDSEGRFEIFITDALNTGLIISCPGYELMAYKPEFIEGRKYLFKLEAKPKTDNKLTVTPIVKKGWLDLFQQIILGVAEEAEKCTITNLTDIYFEAKGNNTFSVIADKPLIVINKMLGYKISVDLPECWFNETTGQSDFTAFMYYQELDTVSSSRYLSNRKNYHSGSSMHFYRSLVADELYRDGFTVFLVKPAIESLKTASQKDSILLAKSPGDFKPLAAREILYIDSSNNFFIRTNGQLLVQYNKNPHTKTYSFWKALSNDFLSQEQGLISGFLDEGIESYISFSISPVGISSAGFLADMYAVDMKATGPMKN